MSHKLSALNPIPSALYYPMSLNTLPSTLSSAKEQQSIVDLAEAERQNAGAMSWGSQGSSPNGMGYFAGGLGGWSLGLVLGFQVYGWLLPRGCSCCLAQCCRRMEPLQGADGG